MEMCCVKGCDSHDKCNEKKNIGYFQFPLHDEILLKKWLRQINLLNWKPSSYHRICSMHFQEQDLVRCANKNESYLKFTSVPTIFPSQPVEIIKANETNNSHPAISLHSQLELAKAVNVVGCNGDVSLSQISPVVLIPTQYSGQLPVRYATEIIRENINNNSIHNPVDQISGECTKELEAQNSQLHLHNSVEYFKQMQQQKSLPDQWYIMHVDAENSMEIKTNGAQKCNQYQNQNLVQASVQYVKEVVTLPNCGVIREQYTKKEKMKTPAVDEPQMPTWQPRLRKILPKPQSFDPNTLPAVKIVPQRRSKSLRNLVPKPDVLIVPRIEAGKAAFSRYPGNKKPILRISIDKEYGFKKSHTLSDKLGKKCLENDAKINVDSMENENSLRREMTIENSSTNKAVTFKLDSRTGEIIVSTRQLDDSIKDDSASKFTKTKRKVDDNTIPSAPKFRQLYIKGQQECTVLKKRLRVLRQRHKQEQEEIEKLQEHLTELGDKGEKTRSQEQPPKWLCCTRKGREKSRVQSDEYQSLLSPVNKIKQKLRTDVAIRQTGDLAKEILPGGNCHNGASRSPKVIKPVTVDRKLRRKRNS